MNEPKYKLGDRFLSWVVINLDYDRDRFFWRYVLQHVKSENVFTASEQDIANIFGITPIREFSQGQELNHSQTD